MALKKIAEGAEAIIYATDVLGIPAVVKERMSKSYRQQTLDEKIRSERTRSEARILSRASNSGAAVPRVLMVSKYAIYTERLPGDTLNRKRLSESERMRALKRAGSQLALIHNAGITHGDYTTANILVGDSKVWVIDFGLGEMTSSVESRALDVLLMKRSISKEEYKVFEKAYSAGVAGREVLKRVAEIEKRGRYQARTLLTA